METLFKVIGYYGDCAMNELFLKLLELKNKLNHKGWITIVPCENESLMVRVEWYLDQKYGYQQQFTIADLRIANVDLADYFIESANHEIELMIGRSS